jgi:hypothetical protein
MNKIPTVFRRDPDDRKRILPEADPACQWVLDGEGRRRGSTTAPA